MPSHPWTLSRLLSYFNLPNSFIWEKRTVQLRSQNQQRKSDSFLTPAMNTPEVSAPALVSIGLKPAQPMSSTLPVQTLLFLKLFPWTVRWKKIRKWDHSWREPQTPSHNVKRLFTMANSHVTLFWRLYFNISACELYTHNPNKLLDY